jgi:lambda family phage portal protein
MAAVVSGMFTIFVKSEGEGLNLDGAMGTETGGSKSDADLKLGYGAIVDLKPNESIESANPGRPNANFDPFFLAIVRQIGVGLEIPHEILLKSFTASYSASRAAMVEAWKFYKGRREWLVSSFCQPVYEAWLEEAVAIGRIDAPGFFDDPAIRKAYCGVTWHGDAMPQIDPVKEVDAASRRIQAGLSTHARETAALTGADWSTEHTILAAEIKERQEKGTIIDLNPESFGDPSKTGGAIGAPAAPAPDDGSDDDTETSGGKR